MRFLTVNLGTMTGKSREVANMLKRRRVSIAYVCKKPSGKVQKPKKLERAIRCITLVQATTEMA